MAQHMTKNEMLKKAFASAVAFTTLACSVPFSPLNINSGALPTNVILVNAEEDSATFTKNLYYGLKLLNTNDAFANLGEGDTLFFAPTSTGFTPGTNITSIPQGTAILENNKTENGSKSYITQKYSASDISTYVHVKEKGNGFDGCVYGGLVNGGTSYFCYYGGVRDLKGSTFQCSNTKINVKATPKTIVSSLDDTDIKLAISCDVTSFEYQNYTFDKSKAKIGDGKIDIPIIIHGVTIDGDYLGDVTLDLTFDFVYSYKKMQNAKVSFNSDFSKATLVTLDDTGKFTNTVVLDINKEGDNQVISQADNHCTTTGKIERLSSSDCKNKGEISYRATFNLNGSKITYEKPFAEDVYGDHKLTHYDRVDNKCKADGSIEYWKCETCGKFFSDAEATTEISEKDIVIPRGHSYVEKIDDAYLINDEATCEHGYQYLKVCERCSLISTDTFYDDSKALGHIFDDRSMKWKNISDYAECEMSLTCKRDGCGKKLTYTAKEGVYEGVDEMGTHYTGSVTSEVTSDCTKGGTITYYATFNVYENGEENEPKTYTATYDKDYPAIGHDLVYMDAKEPTCTEDGNKAGYYCSICGNGFTGSDCTQKIEGFIIEATGHQHTTDYEFNAPTCTEDGNAAYTYCEDCDTIIKGNFKSVDETIIPATGHKMYETEEELLAHTQFVWNKEELEKSYAVIKCDNCKDAAAIICEYVDSEVVNVREATCQQKGFDSYNAEFYNKEYDITVNGSLLINKDKVAHKYDENGVCESCNMHIASASVKKVGDYISSGKLRIKYIANSVCNDEDYEIVKTGVKYSTDLQTFKEAGKDNVSVYEANVADYGIGNAVVPFVIVKNKKDGTTFRIDGEQVNGQYTLPELQIVKNGDYISSGKNRVKFTISPAILPEGYTVKKTGVYYNNGEGNATAEFDKNTWKSAEKAASSYEVNVADNGSGVSLKGYAIIERIDGSVFTLETDVMHGEYTRPEISIKSESIINAAKQNRVKLSFDTIVPEEGYTIIGSGINYISEGQNSVYTFDKANAKNFDAQGETSASVEIRDDHFGITAQAYIIVKDTAGNEFTFTTDIIHTTFKAPVN